MTEDEVSTAIEELRSLCTNVVGFYDLAHEFYKNDSVDQLKADAYVYACGHVLARRVFSLSQRLDEGRQFIELADALRPMRQLCANVIGANAWVDSDAASEHERLICHGQAYASGYALALWVIRINNELTGRP
jgi:hypothetical protein